MKKWIEKINLINKAIGVATTAHAGQVRKGSNLPYITHPYSVAMLARRYTDDNEIIIACLLHDVLEDVKLDIYSKQQMLEDFGEKITDLVQTVSEPKVAGEPEKPWRERKDAYFERLHQAKANGDKRAIVVSCADKVCNLNDVLNDYAEVGDKIWQRFKAGKFEQLWFYEKCLQEAEGAVPTGMLKLYEELVHRLEKIACVNAPDPKWIVSSVEQGLDPFEMFDGWSGA